MGVLRQKYKALFSHKLAFKSGLKYRRLKQPFESDGSCLILKIVS